MLMLSFDAFEKLIQNSVSNQTSRIPYAISHWYCNIPRCSTQLINIFNLHIFPKFLRQI